MRRAAALVLVLAWGSSGQAQEPPLVVLRGAPSALARWRTPLDADAAAGRTAREALRTYAEVTGLLSQAREAAGNLEEGRALTALVRARRLLEGQAALPGAARWLAEVELQLGVIAAQAGQGALADDAFVRAALLDPGRRLRPAEAPPRVAERAARARQTVAARPLGRFPLRVEPAGDVRVSLDGRALGTAPRGLQARQGRHLLQVLAPGLAPYGEVIDVFPGQRPVRRVVLQPSARAQLQARLEAAPSVDAVPGLLAGSSLRAWWLRVASDGERALRLRCSAQGCGPVERLEAGELDAGAAPESTPEVLDRGSPSLRLAAAQAWLRGPGEDRDATRTDAPRAVRVVLGALAAALAGGIAAAALAPRPDPGPRIRIDPGDLNP